MSKDEKIPKRGGSREEKTVQHEAMRAENKCTTGRKATNVDAGGVGECTRPRRRENLREVSQMSVELGQGAVTLAEHPYRWGTRIQTAGSSTQTCNKLVMGHQKGRKTVTLAEHLYR